MKKLILLILVSIAVYGADLKDIKNSNNSSSGYDKCVEILKETIPPLYVNVKLYNILPEQAKPYCTALGLYLNFLIESPKEKAKK